MRLGRHRARYDDRAIGIFQGPVEIRKTEYIGKRKNGGASRKECSEGKGAHRSQRAATAMTVAVRNL